MVSHEREESSSKVKGGSRRTNSAESTNRGARGKEEADREREWKEGKLHKQPEQSLGQNNRGGAAKTDRRGIKTPGKKKKKNRMWTMDRECKSTKS